MISGFLTPLGSFSLRFSFGTLASQLGFPDYSQDYKHKSHHHQFVVCKYQKAELPATSLNADTLNRFHPA